MGGVASLGGIGERAAVMWTVSHKYDKHGAALADGHYSRRTPGSPQFMPPGETLVLMLSGAVFGWWRPHPRSGLRAMNGLDGWTCTIFRNTTTLLSSELILHAETALVDYQENDPDCGGPCGPDGMLTYVHDRKVRSTNPGWCFQCAGWTRRGRSADGRKTLLGKPINLAGVAASPWPTGFAEAA